MIVIVADDADEGDDEKAHGEHGDFALQTEGLRLRKDGFGIQKRQVRLAHDAEVYGIKRDHGEDACEKCGDLELRCQKPRDDAGKHAREKGGGDGDER